jgi:hypothetical protein
MSETETQNLTHHAQLVAWGQYAHTIGLIEKLESLDLGQKSVKHTPQSKVIESFVAVLAGYEYLKEISESAYPLDQDLEVARAWGQASWADYSGVSRTLSQLTQTTVQEIAALLEEISQPMIDKEVLLASQQGKVILDGDLSPRPVSNASESYPDAAYGHMNEEIGLGFQASLVTLVSPTYGRLGLAVHLHPGDTASCTQAETLVLEAERRLGRYPWRRVDLLMGRIEQAEAERRHRLVKIAEAQQRIIQEQKNWEIVRQQELAAQEQVTNLEQKYRERHLAERPQSQLATARQKVQMYAGRLGRRQQTWDQAQLALSRHQTFLLEQSRQIEELQARLLRFQQENALNPAPLEMVFRLDAGFGTSDNLALLIEMGYEVFTKPYSNWLTGELRQRQAQSEAWVAVGRNAEMQAWPHQLIPNFPYLLDLGYERFWVGADTYRQSGMLHFGPTDVTTDLSPWFEFYNARQTIEAANREGKQVFGLHHLKVRSAPALQLQEVWVLFAANFVRFASQWLAEQCPQIPDGWQETEHPHIKQQVKVAAHTMAWVTWQGQDCMLRFADRTIWAGRSLFVKREWAFQPVLPFLKSAVFATI